MVQGAAPFLILYEDCNQMIKTATHLLTHAGFTVVASFDLQTACAKPMGCTCPQHGTDFCTCQFAILLVYGEDAIPASLVLQGNDERTEFSIVEIPGQAISPAFKAKIMSTLHPSNFLSTAWQFMPNDS